GNSDGTTIQGNVLRDNIRAIDGPSTLGQGHVISGNDLSNAAQWAIRMNEDDLLQITGDNVFHGSANGIDLVVVDGLMLSGLDLSQVPGVGLRLSGVTNSTFSGVVAGGATGIAVTGGGGNTFTGVNVSWLGATPSGAGIVLNNSPGNLIEDSTVTNRATGFGLRGDPCDRGRSLFRHH
ncbi:MAG: right-handed parallel beta-helix repeat-containing protein, partial [Chloroflexi bacterium]|nr:right-handed parallel beta-helix repeat-containing protein [Chloroflexota bacterium]